MRITAAFLLALPMALSLLATPVSAETGVRAVVCTGDSQPTLDVLPDINDTVLRVNTVRISGLVERVSAVEVYVNTEYDQTFAIPANETAFATTIRLPIGTHTVRVVGMGICGGDASEEAVVTVIPWNSGFARPQANDPGDSTASEQQANPKSEQSSNNDLGLGVFFSQVAGGLMDLLQAIFPIASPKEVILTTVFLSVIAAPLLPSSMLAHAGASQIIAGRRILFLAIAPFIALWCISLSA